MVCQCLASVHVILFRGLLVFKVLILVSILEHCPCCRCLPATYHLTVFPYRKLQEDLTDEMVVLARQLKESGLVMSQSIQNTEKVSLKNCLLSVLFIIGLCRKQSVLSPIYRILAKSCCIWSPDGFVCSPLTGHGRPVIHASITFTSTWIDRFIYVFVCRFSTQQRERLNTA